MWSTKLNFLGKEQWDCEIVSDITLPLQQNNFTSVLKYPGLQNVLNITITILNLVDPLATNDAIWCRVTLVACYQLEESGLTIVFVLAKTVG